jgi:hypothetical protein
MGKGESLHVMVALRRDQNALAASLDGDGRTQEAIEGPVQ